MVGVLVQRHPGTGNWDDGGRDLSLAVDWVKANAGRFRGDGNRIFIAAHSAGTGPLGVYVGHPERWKNGVQVQGAVYMSGTRPAAGGGGGGLAAPVDQAGLAPTLGSTTAPPPTWRRTMGRSPDRSGQRGRRLAVGDGRSRGGQPLTPEQIAERDNCRASRPRP
jgi:acetyl esterase/lipase